MNGWIPDDALDISYGTTDRPSKRMDDACLHRQQ